MGFSVAQWTATDIPRKLLAAAREGGHRGERVGEAAHPGPSQPQELVITSCNIRSGNGAWGFLQHKLDTAKLRVFLLHEARFKEREFETFQRSAQKHGFRSFFTPGNTYLDR